MKKYSISPPLILIMAAFIVIDGTLLSFYTVIFALLHELAHILTILFFKNRMFSFKGKALGFSITTNALGYKQEAAVCLAGPLFSLFCFVLFAVLSYFNHMPRQLVFIAACNLSLFLINILPLYPLDGGRALFCLLSLKFQQHRAYIIIKIISYIFLLPLCILSVIILVETGYNLSLIIICIYLLLLLLGVINI